MAGVIRPASPGPGSSCASRISRRAIGRGGAMSGLAAVAMLAAACGSSAAGTSSGYGGSSGNGGKATSAKGVSTRQLSGIGKALVTSAGMTIYTPRSPAETGGNIKCTGPCLSFWSPVTGSSVKASGLPGTFGTIHRPDGKTQLTYDGRPLYTFRLDTSAGQSHNNFQDSFGGTSFTWAVVTAAGVAGGAGGGASPAPSSSYSYGSGY
jgi:predicted lipoprotein with Yx(FWY)xxD motif